MHAGVVGTCCVCDPSERLDAYSIWLLFVFFVYRKLFPHLGESWTTGVCSPYVVSLCSFAYYVFE